MPEWASYVFLSWPTRTDKKARKFDIRNTFNSYRQSSDLALNMTKNIRSRIIDAAMALSRAELRSECYLVISTASAVICSGHYTNLHGFQAFEYIVILAFAGHCCSCVPMSGQSKSKPTKQPVSRRFKAPKITKVPARRGWTTASQEALLTGAIPQYLANKLKGPFFENFYGIWDNKFPLSLDSPEEIKEGAPSAKRLEDEHNVSI